MQAYAKSNADCSASLRQDIAKAERQLAQNPDDPYHASVECRRFLERLCAYLADRHDLPRRGKGASRTEELGKFIERLANAKEKCIGIPELHYADQIREAGNGVHIDKALELRAASEAIENCKKLADWFERSSKVSARSTAAPIEALTSHASTNPKVVQFPKRDSAQSPPSEHTSPPNLGEYHRSKIENAKPRKWGGMLAGVAVLVIAALTAWHYWSVPAQSQLESFAQTQTYTVVPGADAVHVNERGGPGTNYPILGQLDRGATVTGIGRGFDKDNVSWIELADGRGYVKEALLTIPSSTPVPASSPAQTAPQSIIQTAPTAEVANMQPAAQDPVISEPQTPNGQSEHIGHQRRGAAQARTDFFVRRPAILPPHSMMPPRYRAYGQSNERMPRYHMPRYQERHQFMRPRFGRPR